MKKIIPIVILILIIGSLFYWLASVLFFSTEPQPNEPNLDPITSSGDVRDPNGSGAVDGTDFDRNAAVQFVQARDGQSLPVANLTAQPNVQVLDDDFYVLGEDAGSEQYSIYYYTDENLIYINLYSEPLEAIRFLAEEKLHSVLKKPDGVRLTDREICTLNISVKTNQFVNTEYAGRELGLSFCPGSVQF